MSFLPAFHGVLAILVLTALIFVEETGVPLPLAPGDLILLSAGVLIASGALSPWAFLPAAVGAAIAGGVVGYSWTRILGARGLRTLATRLRIDHRLDRLERRIQGAGVTGIFVGRLLIPGMRVNTTLLAGALGVPRRTFLLALVPSVIMWVGTFTGLGVLAGVPLEHFLARADHALVQGAELITVGVAGYLAARYAPGRRAGDADPILLAPARERLLLAVVVDIAAIATIVGGVDLFGRDLLHVGQINDLLDGSATSAITVAAYFLASRGSFGLTAGEGLFRVSYRRRRRGGPPGAGSADGGGALTGGADDEPRLHAWARPIPAARSGPTGHDPSH